MEIQKFYKINGIILKVPETKTVEFANSVHQKEAAHYELPHLDIHCLNSKHEKLE